jgi:hypothetical protein
MRAFHDSVSICLLVHILVGAWVYMLSLCAHVHLVDVIKSVYIKKTRDMHTHIQ